MKETKFTPGPWKIEEPNFEELTIHNDEIDICTVYRQGEYEEQGNANGKLISYSPDMYSVLEEVTPILNYAINSTSSGDLRNQITELNVKIQLILDKING